MAHSQPPAIAVTIGVDTFRARLREDLEPESCRQLQAFLPYCGDALHARWSGESLWSPLRSVWPLEVRLSPRNPTSQPKLGDILLCAGARSEPELRTPYGPTRFASRSGSLQGSVVLTLDYPHERLEELGPGILWGGARRLRIE